MELWKWNPSLFESSGGIVASLSRSSHSIDDDSICFEATRSLLDDVVDAAGGVERALDRLHESIDQVRVFHASAVEQHGQLTEGTGLGGPAAEDAWYAIEELLVWARALDERLRRPARTKGFPDQGLIPALADGPRRDAVISARSKMLTTAFGEARYLAGLNLHQQSMQSGTKTAQVRAGDVVLAFPDRVMRPVSHRWELTYRDNRDGMSFADGVFAAIECFMDEMLAAFEMHLPERFNSP
jgi:hypothetical protein